MTQDQPRFIVAGTHSGAGKTTLSVGLMAAYHRRGFKVQGYKVGPDFIDPSYHTAVTGRISRNLDSYLCSRDTVREILLRSCEGADLLIIEGVMGLYDGKDPRSDTGSTAEMAKWLETPVILCLDASGMARSAAATVMGYQNLDSKVRIAGVIANRLGGEGHFQLIRAAVENECGIPVLGYLPDTPTLAMPERHLGLIPAIERGSMTALFDHLAAHIEASIQLDVLLSVAKNAPCVVYPRTRVFEESFENGVTSFNDTRRITSREQQPRQHDETLRDVTIAVAKDSAFNFYYPENIELLERSGAHIQYFSPLSGEKIPGDADGLYLGGGFPEEFASILESQTEVLDDFREKIVETRIPTFAECGGFMFLCRSITTKEGSQYSMVGVIPASVFMQNRLVGLGYREVVARADNPLLLAGQTARGHEFHYSSIEFDDHVCVDSTYAFEAQAWKGIVRDGYAKDNLLAGYTHLHFASNPTMARRFVEYCRSFRGKRGK